MTNSYSIVAPKKPFSWHDYVEIAATPKNKGLIEQTLNGISAAHDHEGEELIRYAAKNGKKILIKEGKNTFTDTVNGQLTVVLDFDHIARLGVFSALRKAAPSPTGANKNNEFYNAAGKKVESGTPVHVSLTSVLIHELYHGSIDQKNLRDKALPELVKLLERHRIPEPISVIDKFLKGYATNSPTVPYMILMGKIQNQTSAFLNDSEKLWEEIISFYKKKKEAGVVKMLEEISTTKFSEAMARAGVLDADGTPIWETDAVKFTDAFMRKNYGNKEPPRIKYANATSLIPENTLRIFRKPDLVAHATTGFNACEAEPRLQCDLPRIRPIKDRTASHP